MPRKPSAAQVAEAVAVSAIALVLGEIALGPLPMLIFAGGFIGGLLLWLLAPSRGEWPDIRAPYWTTLVLFLLHRIEEKQYGFFDYLAQVTEAPKPELDSAPVVALVVISVGAWLLIPVLMRRAQPFGRYLAWTFFASMGITEVAHFLVFPWLSDELTLCVPGMWTVVALAPAAWWGMARLALGFHRRDRPEQIV